MPAKPYRTKQPEVNPPARVVQLPPSKLSEATLADAARSGLVAIDCEALRFKEVRGFNPGYRIPYRNIGTEFARTRHHKGERRYSQERGTDPHLYLPSPDKALVNWGPDWEAIKANASKSLYVVEGEKKAAALCKAGFAAIGVGGVGCWRGKGGVLPEWDAFVWTGRTVTIVYDADIVAKPAVAYEEAALGAELTGRGATVLCLRLPRETKGADDFLVANGFPADLERARAAWSALPPKPVAPVTAAMRRAVQLAEAQRIGDGADGPRAVIFDSVEDAVDRLVFLQGGAWVALRGHARSALRWSDASGAYAASQIEVSSGAGTKFASLLPVWRMHPARKTVHTLTFAPGREEFTTDPEGHSALNLWSPLPHETPANWEQAAALFTDHVRWLFGEYADKFLDWVAHIEQRPEVLPHSGWLHIAPRQGLGRNWISCALARVWPGYVAANFRLVQTLKTGYNGRLSCKLLAIVDEINEGGNERWRHSEELKSLLNEEFRLINPKCDRQSTEFNVTRWLIFSNHYSALPLNEGDRRFFVVSNDAVPRPAAYYVKLYGALDEPDFAPSVREFLRRRDVSRFNPGEAPPMTEAKARLINLNKSEAALRLEQLVRAWPSDLITFNDLRSVCGLDGGSLHEQGEAARRIKHDLDRADIRKHAKRIRLDEKVNVKTYVYVIRNHDFWTDRVEADLRKELLRLRDEVAALGSELPGGLPKIGTVSAAAVLDALE